MLVQLLKVPWNMSAAVLVGSKLQVLNGALYSDQLTEMDKSKVLEPNFSDRI